MKENTFDKLPGVH